MRDCLILGSGRSGTSMLAGMMAGGGYFMGSEIFESLKSETNPKGLFEDRVVNGINEDLIAVHMPRPLPTRFGHRLSQRRVLPYGLRWLAVLPADVRIQASPEIDRRIAELVEARPFCFKDP